MVSSYRDTELLIMEIQNRPVLWDPSLEGYRNKMKKNDAWTEVCTVFHPDFELMENAKQKQIRK